MREVIYTVKEWIENIHNWYEDVIVWKYFGGEKRFRTMMAKAGIYFDDKGDLIQ